MKIAIFEIDEPHKRPFERLASRHWVRSTEARLSEQNVEDFHWAEIISVFINSRIDDSVLEKLPSLKMITTRSTGFEHIDLVACEKRNISVCHVPGYGENSVAEHVFALLLTISHRMLAATKRTKSGHFSPEDLIGFDLAGKTLGVIGAGAIGRRVIEIAYGFSMRVIVHDIAETPDSERGKPTSIMGFDELLAEADIISLHLPLTAQSKGLFSSDVFARMKHGAILINTARGGLVDNEALIHALNTGQLFAAGLDVVEDEALLIEEAELVCGVDCARRDLEISSRARTLLNMPNVVATPHSAFYTHEAMQRIADTTIESIESFVHGAPINLVFNSKQNTA